MFFGKRLFQAKPSFPNEANTFFEQPLYISKNVSLGLPRKDVVCLKCAVSSGFPIALFRKAHLIYLAQDKSHLGLPGPSKGGAIWLHGVYILWGSFSTHIIVGDHDQRKARAFLCRLWPLRLLEAATKPTAKTMPAKFQFFPQDVQLF